MATARVLIVEAPDFKKIELLSDSKDKVKKFVATYAACDMDIEKTAAALGITKSNAATQLSRLKDKIQLKELETVLQHQFGFKDEIQNAASAILPCIEKMMQRTVSEYPKTWEQALALELKPKVRRVKEDRTKTSWMGSVRHLVRLWKEQPIAISACADEDQTFNISASADVDYFEPLLTAEEAAQLLRCHEKTVQALARAGKIPALRFGKYWRFRKSTLDTWVEQQINLGNQSRRVS